MDDTFLVRMLHRSAHQNEKLHPLAYRELPSLAVIRELLSDDQFHHEEGPARFGRSGVQHTGDIGMVHHRQGLALGLEARDNGLRIHAMFQDLERDLSLHWLLLLRYVHRRKTTLADLLE